MSEQHPVDLTDVHWGARRVHHRSHGPAKLGSADLDRAVGLGVDVAGKRLAFAVQTNLAQPITTTTQLADDTLTAPHKVLGQGINPVQFFEQFGLQRLDSGSHRRRGHHDAGPECHRPRNPVLVPLAHASIVPWDCDIDSIGLRLWRVTGLGVSVLQFLGGLSRCVTLPANVTGRDNAPRSGVATLLGRSGRRVGQRRGGRVRRSGSQRPIRARVRRRTGRAS